MRYKFLLLFFILSLLEIGSIGAQDEVSDLLGRINNLRASKGLTAYTLNSSLSVAAQQQAQWMIDNGAVTHVHPDGSSPRSRAAAAGYGSSFVSENIYGGTNATTNDAWRFWINSPIHYAGLVNISYQEIGIGAAHGKWGAAYVLVFGSLGGYVQPQANTNSSEKNNAASAPRKPPSYVVGVDEHGNIKHEVQEGDTTGQIALIYGYTWADIPAMLALNNMTEADSRTLKVGSIFLVPPKSGTYTPSPNEITATASSTPAIQASATSLPTATFVPTNTPLPTTTPALTATSLPSPTPAQTVIAQVSTAQPLTQAGITITSGGTSPWLGVALLVQAGVLVLAGFEFIRRVRRRR
jgi:hypothetical protein